MISFHEHLVVLVTLSMTLNIIVAQETNEYTTPAYAEKYGYRLENHTVTTEDGYILTMHRILSNCNGTTKGAPVFLQHGLFGTSFAFVVLGPEKALAFLLADECYDVWMGNSRGNDYSTGHVTLSITNIEYWDFSWHEMGVHDLPASIDYVLNVTGHNALHFIGHSMGTTMFFVMLSVKPEYNCKIIFATVMAPVAYMAHVQNSIVKSAVTSGDISIATIAAKPEGRLSQNVLVRKFLEIFCKMEQNQNACGDTSLFLLGINMTHVNESVRPAIESEKGDCSMKTLAHYGQVIQSVAYDKRGIIRWYSYPTNLIRYRQLVPPPYNLQETRIPTFIASAPDDKLASPEDVETVIQTLPNVTEAYQVPYPEFNHIDFMICDNATMVYKKVIEMVNKHTVISISCPENNQQDKSKTTRSFWDWLH